MRIYEDYQSIQCRDCGKGKIKKRDFDREFIGYLALGLILAIAFGYSDNSSIRVIGILGLIIWGYHLWKSFKEEKK